MGNYRVADPTMGRVAYWSFRGRSKGSSLYEGSPGFGRRILAQIEPERAGGWIGSYMSEEPSRFSGREEALQAMSRRVFDELDLEVRTNSRVVVRRPGGIVDAD